MRYFIKAASVLLLLTFWQVAALWVGRDILLPSPQSVAASLGAILIRDDFWPSVLATMERFLLAFGLSMLAALLLGALAGRFSLVYELLSPYLQLARSVPTVAIILLVMIWLRSHKAPIAVGFLMAFPILYFNVVEGMRSVDKKLLEMAKVYRLPCWTVFFKLYLPGMKSFLMAGAFSAVGTSLKMVIAAEVFSQPDVGIGTRFQMARMGLDAPALFAWAILAVVLNAAVDGALKLMAQSI